VIKAVHFLRRRFSWDGYYQIRRAGGRLTPASSPREPGLNSSLAATAEDILGPQRGWEAGLSRGTRIDVAIQAEDLGPVFGTGTGTGFRVSISTPLDGAVTGAAWVL